MGAVMGATHDFTLSPVHAHVNLLGWVSMTLFGVFYRCFPEAAVRRSARIHFGANVLGLAVFAPALAANLLGAAGAGPALGAASVILVTSFAIFAFVVSRATGLVRPRQGTAVETSTGNVTAARP